ncbi:Survival of motor neuron splicing factor [Paragonimus heterotremus]|uniref:Survival of motor neuron splicing factor n=1 Tax=Paragonimus heterotremus TaxID=100268 RepID=A0A8J4WCY7_9TREM|nr:Survival of motor neuron splicing factor [Paragonimus heterotremus]
MADDAQLDLLNHKLQLQQVDAALELDKDNEELKILKRDLQEVIRLSVELLGKASDANEIEWHVGDQCMAMCSRDKLFYRATILEFLGDTSCVVNFDTYDMTDVCQICHLKPVTTIAPVTKKKTRDIKARAIEKKKQKKLRLQQRQEEIETFCETEKNRWLNFSKKMIKTGKTKRSIFASPDAPDGRVGVGTCGIGGRPMTKYAMVNHNLRKS